MLNKLSLAAAASVLYSVSAMADTAATIAVPWLVSKQSAYSFTADPDPTKKDWGRRLTTQIDFGTAGKKSIYFSIWYANSDTYEASPTSYCDPSDFLDNGVVKVSGQAIKVFRWCRKYPDGEAHYLEMAPVTDAGLAFIVKRLSQSQDDVVFDENGNIFKISAKGFTASWNKDSESAL